MLAWFRFLSRSISISMFLRSAAPRFSRRTCLMATVSPVPQLRARYTLPKAPLPRQSPSWKSLSPATSWAARWAAPSRLGRCSRSRGGPLLLDEPAVFFAPWAGAEGFCGWDTMLPPICSCPFFCGRGRGRGRAAVGGSMPCACPLPVAASQWRQCSRRRLSRGRGRGGWRGLRCADLDRRRWRCDMAEGSQLRRLTQSKHSMPPMRHHPDSSHRVPPPYALSRATAITRMLQAHSPWLAAACTLANLVSRVKRLLRVVRGRPRETIGEPKRQDITHHKSCLHIRVMS